MIFDLLTLVIVFAAGVVAAVVSPKLYAWATGAVAKAKDKLDD